MSHNVASLFVTFLKIYMQLPCYHLFYAVLLHTVTFTPCRAGITINI